MCEKIRKRPHKSTNEGTMDGSRNEGDERMPRQGEEVASSRFKSYQERLVEFERVYARGAARSIDIPHPCDPRRLRRLEEEARLEIVLPLTPANVSVLSNAPFGAVVDVHRQQILTPLAHHEERQSQAERDDSAESDHSLWPLSENTRCDDEFLNFEGNGSKYMDFLNRECRKGAECSRKRKHPRTRSRSSSTETRSSSDLEPPCKTKQSEITDSPRRKEARISEDHLTKRLSDSSLSPSPTNNKSKNVQAEEKVSNTDSSSVEIESDPSSNRSSRIERKRKRASREKHVKSRGEEGPCKECKDKCSCKDSSSSKDDDVLESDADVGKKSPASSDEKVPELTADRVGRESQPLPALHNIGKIRLNLSNLPRFRERFLRESSLKESGADSSRKRRRIRANDSAREEDRVRRKTAIFRQLFGDIQTQSEEESERDIWNTRKRRKKNSSDSYDSGLCPEDYAFSPETGIQSDLKTTAAPDDIVESLNCEETHDDKESNKTVEAFREARKHESTENKRECNKDKHERNEKKEKEIDCEDEDSENKENIVDNVIKNTKNKALCSMHVEEESATGRFELPEKEVDTTAVTDKAIESDSTRKRDRIRCNDNVVDKPDTILRDNVQVTCSLSLRKVANLSFFNKSNNIESPSTRDSEGARDNSLLNKDNISEQVREEPTSSLTRQEAADANKSSVMQRESNKEGCDLSSSISSERSSENVDDKLNSASITDLESTNRHETDAEAVVEEDASTENESVNDNVNNEPVNDNVNNESVKDNVNNESVNDNVITKSPKRERPLVIKMQELSKESLMAAAKTYFAEHLRDIIKSALTAENAQHILPEKMAKEFVESLGVPETSFERDVNDAESNVEVDKNRNICEKGTDSTTSKTNNDNVEVSSHTISCDESPPVNVRTSSETENIHNPENSTPVENENSGSSEDGESTNQGDTSTNHFTETDNSQNRDEVPKQTTESPESGRLRVRTGVELGARWCPTPTGSPNFVPRPRAIAKMVNTVPTSASGPPPSTTLPPTVPSVPPNATAPPPINPKPQEVGQPYDIHKQIKKLMLRVFNRIHYIRRNLQEQGVCVGTQQTQMERRLILQRDCFQHAVTLKQDTLSLFRLLAVPDERHLLMIIIKEFNKRVRVDQSLTLAELLRYLNPDMENQSLSIDNTSQMTPQCNMNVNNVQPAGNVMGLPTSYVRVNVPFNSYVNAPMPTNNALYMSNTSQDAWRGNKQQNPPPSYMAATGNVAQQHTSNCGMNQVHGPAQNPMNLPNSYQIPQMAQAQRMPGAPIQNSGSSVKLNIVTIRAPQSGSPSANVGHDTTQNSLQQLQQLSLNLPQNFFQRMTRQNSQPPQAQQIVNPCFLHGGFVRALNPMQKNVDQVPQQGVNGPPIIPPLNLWPGIQYLSNVYGALKASGQAHNAQINANHYQNSQQPPFLLLQNAPLLATFTPETPLPQATPSQNLLKHNFIPIAPAVPQQNGSFNGNSATGVPQMASSTGVPQMASSTGTPSPSPSQNNDQTTHAKVHKHSHKDKHSDPQEKDDTQKSQFIRPKQTIPGKLLTTKKSFSNWSPFTEIQKMILVQQLNFYWKHGLSYPHVPQEERLVLRSKRYFLKQFHKSLMREIEKLQSSTKENSNNDSATSAPTQTAVPSNQVTQRSSEPLHDTVNGEANKSPENVEDQSNNAQSSKEQNASDETEHFQEVPVNSPAESLNKKNSESANIGAQSSSEEETQISTEQPNSSNVDEPEVGGQLSSEGREEIQNEEQVERVSQINSATEEETQLISETRHSENPEVSNRSSVSESVKITENASQPMNTKTAPTVTENVRENSNSVSPETIKTESTVSSNVVDGVNKFEQTERSISANLSILEESIENEKALLFMDELSDKGLYQNELKVAYAGVVYQQVAGGVGFTIPNIADVRSIEPEVFQQINTAEYRNAVSTNANQSGISVEPRDNTINTNEMAGANVDMSPRNVNQDIINGDVLCLRCKRTQSTVLCKLCLEAHYCSKRCQELHWKAEHHKSCRQSTKVLHGTEKPPISRDSSSPTE